ncbi:hypothetical protein [Microbacterium dauci]|uniref:Uncharacterized protein n=1 Tax=Microbacterium dauci TaxID=3048008 RepID=A0ABT6ZH70_9MICO|nr:hypothetical protein [Microbacterium sp. LX3-4]MDJ1115288.1 hypothetical protein [Microbacterium sp. LX3-4]
MSTPDQPGPPLTRRQLRELRNTASNPVITPEEAEEAQQAASLIDEVPPVAPVQTPPRAAEPVELPEAPSADVDLEAAPVTRRQARQQAKLRTESIDVVADQPDADAAADDAPAEPEVVEEAAEPEVTEPEVDEPAVVAPDDDSNVVDVEPDVDPVDAAESDGIETHDEGLADEEPEAGEPEADEAEEPDEASEPVEAESDADAEASEEEPAAVEKAPVVAPALGANLLAGDGIEADLPPSFDHLLVRGGGGSTSAPNALILSQTPETGSLSVPIMGTGELLITGSYSLPDSYGSTGSTPGSQDGKDVDATLIDGELPPASSPTPIAASSAISTIKSAEDIIRPPAPDKGGRLTMTLAVMAGALALALATVLILAVVNGVF